MQLSTILLLATLSALTTAQNPFTFTILTSITAGTPFNITWAPSTGIVDTITLLLRQGDPMHLSTIQTIAPSIQNSGSYLWTPPSTLVAGTDYAFEIVDDGNTAITNYSNEFSIISSNPVSSALPSSTTATSTSASGSGSTATTTGRASTSVGTSSGRTASTGSTGTAMTSSSTNSAAATSATGKSAAGSVKVGVGLLGFVGAIMALL